MAAMERLTAWNGGEVERAIVDAVSLDVPWRVVERFATLTRLSGSAEEREAFELLIGHLRQWGVAHELHQPECFISIPLAVMLGVVR